MLSASADADRAVVEGCRHTIGDMATSVAYYGHLHLERRAFIQATDVIAYAHVATLSCAADGIDEHSERTLPVHGDAGRAARLVARCSRGHAKRGEGEYGDRDDECGGHRDRGAA